MINILEGNDRQAHCGLQPQALVAAQEELTRCLQRLGPVAIAVSGGVDSLTLATLANRVLPPDKISQNRRFTRLMLSSAMRAHFRTGQIGTLFVMDEFRLTVGKLPIVQEVWAVVREYQMQLMPVVQTLVQLKSLFGDEWETFVGQAGCVATIGPASDHFTAEWMSKRSGNTTILQRGFNLADGVNSGDGANSGFGYSNGGGSSIANGAILPTTPARSETILPRNPMVILE